VKPSGKKIDPFENPPDDLLVANVPEDDPSHIIVLNKYPIIANHFILATKTNKQQTHKLEADDLGIAWRCIKEWNGQIEGGRSSRLFAFFNSGDHSGASQPHRHLQFLPVEDMQAGEAGNSWSLLADSVWTAPDAALEGESSAAPLKSNPKLPLMHFGTRLPTRPSPDELMSTYTMLYETAEREVHEYVEKHPDDLALHDTADGSNAISYNLALTNEVMVICPRRKEGLMLRKADGTDLDFVALNGTLLGGTLMVKNEECFELLKQDNIRLQEVLKAIGLPTTSSRGAHI